METHYTEEFLNFRMPTTSTVEVGRWHAGFSKVKSFADSSGLPLVSLWTSGPECRNCENTLGCICSPEFKTWMSNSGIVFYAGVGSVDMSDDDKIFGSGFEWSRRSEVANYPFLRIYWDSGSEILDWCDVVECAEKPSGTTDCWFKHVENGGATQLIEFFNEKLKSWFNKRLNRFNVKFYSYDMATLLKSQDVVKGGAARPPEAPTITGCAFTGWSPPYNNVQKNLSCAATYSSSTWYTVNFFGYDRAKVIKTQKVLPTTDAMPPDVPDYVDGMQFTRWDGKYENVNTDTSCYAVYSEPALFGKVKAIDKVNYETTRYKYGS